MQLTFFLVINPGLIELALDELNNHITQRKLDVTNIHGDFHGIALQTSIITGLELNTQLKIPTRILLRIKENICKDLPRLFHIISHLPLHQYLYDQSIINLKISSVKSKIFDTSRIQQTTIAGITESKKRQPWKKAPKHLENTILKQTLYLRFDHDVLTVSLDTTGDALYHNGLTEKRMSGSLRENYAYAMSWLLMKYMHKTDIKNPIVVDPFCGSATVALSYLHLSFGVDKLQPRRNFSYQHWRLATSSTQKIKNETNVAAQGHVLISDIDKTTLEYAKHNCRRLGFHPTLSKACFLKDFTEPKQPWFFMSNLPYGENIPMSPLQWQKIIEKMQGFQFCQGLCLITSRNYPCEKYLKNQYKKVRGYPFINSGIPVELSYHEKTSKPL